MTAAERILFSRVQRRASALQPAVAAAVLKAFAALRDSMSERQIVRAIQLGGVDRLFELILTQAVLDVAYAPVREQMRRGLVQSVRYFASDVPKGGRINGQLSIGFDVLNPRHIDAVRMLDTKVVTRLQGETRETIRALAENALRDGANPRVWAPKIREMIGLGPTQLQEVQNYRDALLGQNGRTLSSYTLRPQRYDEMAKRGGMTPAQVDRAVEAYTKRRIALNAETTARTAALDTQRLGQRLSWEDAIEKGLVKRDELYKTWAGVMDDRERPEHKAMENETIPFDAIFSNGETIPGEFSFNCRCVLQYSTQSAA